MIQKVRRFKKGESRQAIFFSTFLGILALIVIGFLIISNWKINQKRAELTTRIEVLEKEIQFLEEKKQKLEAGISQTESDAYWEARIREQGYKRPGEEAVVVLLPEEKQEEKPAQQKSFWQKILEKLGF